MIDRVEYLRDSRHLNKFLFTLSDALFYEPLEKRYGPSTEYLELIAAQLKDLSPRWTTTRDGFWTNVHPGQPPTSADPTSWPYTLPIQGWKIHVSATLLNHLRVLKKTAKIALSNNVPFKFALDRNVLSLMSSKAWSRGGSGKFITLYPKDLAFFKHLIEALYAELRTEEGPYILSDKRYKDCRVLYYRYGGLARTTKLEITGQKIPVLISPNQEEVPDIRSPYFAPPSWVTDPFPDDEAAPDELTLNDGKYLVKEALSFSNSGGVYLAEDRVAGRDVILKEARAHTLMDGKGNDAIILLKREHDILEELRNTDVAPKPLELFPTWENFFLAEEYVDGLDIREIMLTRSPLMKANPSLEDSQDYYQMFRRLFTSFAENLNTLHERGIVFGDLSANNLKVDASTLVVRFIDFEGAFRTGIDNPTFLYTPGFKSAASIQENLKGAHEDLYSMAAVMLYTLFPISALVSIRADLFDTVLCRMLSDVGWSHTPVFEIVRGLSKNEISCTRVSELLAEDVEILPPRYSCDVEIGWCDGISKELARFILGHMRPDSPDSLFPVDPYAHRTNPLSLGFGACGVLHALQRVGFEIPNDAYGWLDRQLDEVRADDLAPGLLTGTSGIAWCLWELGFEDRAIEMMRMANESSLLKRHHSYLYGMSGVGLANLYFYLRTKSEAYLSIAESLAKTLCAEAREGVEGIFWESSGVIQLGFGYGQSGVALFLLRLFEVTGDEDFLATGRRALEFDLAHGIEGEDGVVSFPCAPSDPTLLPYLEEGSAGIAKVAIRYGRWEGLEKILASVHRKYAGFAGLLYGLSSFVDVLTDAYSFSGDPMYLEMAKRPVSGIRDCYLLEHPSGLATPGDGLFRISCDYATGVAGVMRTLHRVCRLDPADFVLDEVATVATPVVMSESSDTSRRAVSM